MLLKIEGFQYATSIYLNMGYYHIRLRKNSSNLCTVIIPWGKYQYKRLPTGVANYIDIFQQKMNDLFHRFELICAYIYDILILIKGDWADNIQNL